MKSFLDKKNIDNLLRTIPKKSIRLHPGSIIKAKPAVEGHKARKAIKSSPATPAVVCVKTGKMLKLPQPSVQPKPFLPAIESMKAVPGGQWFHISVVNFDLLKEVCARLAVFNYYPSEDVKLNSEFSKPEKYHQYVTGFFVKNASQFRECYKRIKTKNENEKEVKEWR